RWDDDTETYDMGFRNYNPSIARFDTRDMYADAAQDIGLAMSLATGSRYAFAGGNPVSFSELDGHLPQAYDTSTTNKEVFKAHRNTHSGESYGKTLTKHKKKLNTRKPKGKACDWKCGKKKRKAKGQKKVKEYRKGKTCNPRGGCVSKPTKAELKNDMNFYLSMTPLVSESADIKILITGYDPIYKENTSRGWAVAGLISPIGGAGAIKNAIKGTKQIPRLSDEGIEYAVKDTSRVQHSFKHAKDLGFGNWNRQVREEYKDYVSNVLRNPTKSFDNKLGRDSVKGFYKEVNGNPVAVYIYKEGPYQGKIATTVKLSPNQMTKFGLD
ncbi:hypothetical protein IC620_15275, partial [Hazenella sp. IB182357]